MLLQFTVGNFKSIADPQEFSLVAGKATTGKKRRSFPTGNTFASHALKTTAILGANGAGKSSFLAALDFFVEFVENSAKNSSDGDEIDVTPFKLDRSFQSKPSTFEAVFVHEEALYQYGFAVDADRVLEEWLFSRPNEANTRMRSLFHRVYNSAGEYSWEINDSYIKGEREVWRKSTRENALFLSTAVQLNSEYLRSPYQWIAEYLRVLPSPDRISPGFTARLWNDGEMRESILRFIKSADLKIEDIGVEEREFKLPKDVELFMSEAGIKRMRDGARNAKTLEIHTFHKATDGSLIRFDIDEESSGTQVLFALAGPWLDVLIKGYTLVVDELHNSLHPLALRHLIEMFYDPEINKSGAQLVFTTHDTTVLSGGLLQKDQVWLLEKNRNGASHLYPLSDFDIRDSESFARGYLNGIFRGLPHPTEFEFGE